MALRCAWSEDSSRVIASDFAGNVALWDTKSGKRLGALDSNPRSLADRIASVQARIAGLRARGDKPSPALAEAEQALVKLESELASARRQADKVQAEFAAGAQEVVRLKDLAAKPNPPTDLDVQLASARALREKARVARTDATNTVEALSQSFSASKAKLEELRKTHNPAAELAEAEAELQKLKRAQARSASTAAQQQSKR
jgi:chromosome segregation ATPase